MTLNETPKRVLIVGAGAVGCFYASRMHHPPHSLVSLVCRSNYKAIRDHGVRLRTHTFGDYTFMPEHVFSSISVAAEAGLVWDYVVVATKALPDVEDESRTIESLVSDRTAVVLIQNGVGVEAPYRARFPSTVLLSAVTVISAEQIEPGLIVQNRWTRISIGPFTDGIGSVGVKGEGDFRAQEFVKLLTDGGVKDAELYEERKLQVVRWHKIAINASMNPSAVLSNGTGNARMAKDAELRHHLRECMQEVFRGAAAVLRLPSFPPDGSGLATADAILRSTERNTGGRPSMLVDWERGGRMELEVIVGNPVRMARAAGVEMARLSSMYALLRMGQERRDEKKSKL